MNRFGLLTCTFCFHRHSSNLNLHHKLLTKDALEMQNNPYNIPYFVKDMPKDRFQDLPLKNPGQTSVIFKGMNRTGSLVYPLNKMRDSCLDSFAVDSMTDNVVLDLSTTSSIKSASSSHSSWDSDGGSEEGNLPVDDSDESCQGLSFIPQDEIYYNWNLVARAQQSFSNIPSGMPITCQICQKTYSNKGTFRAHYKTVHLRQLHKCKVAGCNIMFSSVRSRNRHSQNLNLHRSLSESLNPV